MQAKVHSVVVDGILQLHLSVPAAALEKALTITGQSPVVAQHMTLVRLDDLGVSVSAADLPPPPPSIDLTPEVYLVDTGAKQSCYVTATAAMQDTLREYTLQCAVVLGLNPSAVDPHRVYHATISNAGQGNVRASVGAPWKFTSKPV